MTVLVPTHTDEAARKHEQARRATSVYERHAYLVYNLALRIACERGAAERAAERAFVTVLGRPDPDAEIVATAVRVAIEESPPQPRADGAGDAEASALLRATATLPAPQRAALALGGLCGLDGRGVG
ncbi:MAG TPA: hypothetical protein VHF89_05525, partial [Solirubrobacteraceae bacterium]|nr:hypothetical protein [Solirubrobacteraceae bacterium]